LPANFNRRTSRTWRIVVLSAGIRPFLSNSQKKDRNHSQQRRPYPGGFIPEWVGDIIPESVGGIIPE
jgi:hypothetical protein